MYKIMGAFQGYFDMTEEIDGDFPHLGYARRILAEYRMAFGNNWGKLWIADSWGNHVEG